jgi:hypothetical protein
MEEIEAKIDAKSRAYKKELLFAVLVKKQLMMMWKIICLDILNVPLSLYRRGRRRMRLLKCLITDVD